MTFRLFGYLIGWEKRSINNERKLTKPSCKVISNGKHFLLTMPNGDVLPHQLHCTIIERLEAIPKARIELYVDLSNIGCKQNYIVSDQLRKK